MKSTNQENQKNNLKNVVKNLKNIALVILATVAFASCDSNDDNNNQTTPATAAEFNGIRDIALESLTQEFQFNAEDGYVTFTSDKGVTIGLNGSCLTKNGNPVTGLVDLEFVELFDKGNMLTTNKPTMGLLPNGDKNMLISGGEFFIKATQNGIELDTTCNIQLVVPAGLTGGIDTEMTLWEGITDDAENLVWREEEPGTGGPQGGGVGFEGNNYYVSFGDFGWTNVDKFYNDPRPKTTLLVSVPNGYDNENSAVYLSYDGEGTNALAKLDTYNPTTKQFSEHYGQIPVGLEMHVIFATEDNGMWKYAIKGVTVAANDAYTFTEGETVIGTEAQLVAAINALP